MKTQGAQNYTKKYFIYLFLMRKTLASVLNRNVPLNVHVLHVAANALVKNFMH